MEAMRVIMDAIQTSRLCACCVFMMRECMHGCHVLYDVLCEPYLYTSNSSSESHAVWHTM